MCNKPFYLLSHQVQSALQGVGYFNLPIAVIDLHSSRTANTQSHVYTNIRFKNLLWTQWVRFDFSGAHMSGGRKLSWSMRTSRLFFTESLYLGMFLWMDACHTHTYTKHRRRALTFTGLCQVTWAHLDPHCDSAGWTHLHQLNVLFTAANRHLGLQQLVEALIQNIMMLLFTINFDLYQ